MEVFTQINAMYIKRTPKPFYQLPCTLGEQGFGTQTPVICRFLMEEAETWASRSELLWITRVLTTTAKPPP